MVRVRRISTGRANKRFFSSSSSSAFYSFTYSSRSRRRRRVNIGVRSRIPTGRNRRRRPRFVARCTGYPYTRTYKHNNKVLLFLLCLRSRIISVRTRRARRENQEEEKKTIRGTQKKKKQRKEKTERINARPKRLVNIIEIRCRANTRPAVVPHLGARRHSPASTNTKFLWAFY